MAKDKKSLTRNGRKAYYKELRDIYEGTFPAELDAYAREMALAVAEDTAEATLLAQGVKTGAHFAVSKQWIDDVYTKTFGDNIKRYVAVKTRQMEISDIRTLESAVSDVLRTQAKTGTPARKVATAMQEAVNRYADNPSTWAFIDKAGKKWDSGSYFGMLNRTLATSFTDESLRDVAVENKPDEDKDVYYTIQTAGDPCPICSAWAGVVVTESGADKRFPTLDEAVSGGFRHPNCTCSIIQVFPNTDEVIERQAPIKKPPPKPTKEQWRDYRKEVLSKIPEKVSFNRHNPALSEPTKTQQRARAGAATRKRKE